MGNILANLTDSHLHLSMLNEIAEAGGFPGRSFREIVDYDGERGFILDAGTEYDDFEKRFALAGNFKNIAFSAGIWPSKDAVKNRFKQTEYLLRKITEVRAGQNGNIAAVGECGFDRRENPEPSKEERELFSSQLEIARKTGLPVIVHSRDAARETFEALKEYPDVRGVIHCFSYTKEDAKKFLSLGFFISFAGKLTFKNDNDLKEALKYVPREKLLLETDAPFLAPAPNRGKHCLPEMIAETYKSAALLTGIDIEELKVLIKENARNLFLPRNS